jgi:hypothetical protein
MSDHLYLVLSSISLSAAKDRTNVKFLVLRKYAHRNSDRKVSRCVRNDQQLNTT